MNRAAPIDLWRLVVRHLVPVALATLVLALAAGLWRAGDDVDDEMHAALSHAAVMGVLIGSAGMDDVQLLQALRAQLGRAPLRHVTLSLHDGTGRVRLGPAMAPGASPAWASWLQPGEPMAPVRWPLARPDGTRWTVTVTGTADSERQEAFADLGRLALVVAAGVAAMLGAMAWNVRRGLRPLGDVLAAIGRLRDGDLRAADALPATAVRELQAVGDALRALGAALDAAAEDRRRLSRKLLTLQEDERSFIARELHDEFGQQLTATRIDAAVLQRRLAQEPDLLELVQGLAERTARMQQDLRSLLARLVPREAADGGARGLLDMLEELAAGWRRPGGGGLDVRVECTLADGPEPLSSALTLALYRMSQEAVTNAARHGAASTVTIAIRAQDDDVEWQACDDGVGLADPAAALQRGSGLAGLRERAWALGGDLRWHPARPGQPRPGLCLQARLRVARAEAAP